MAEQKAACKPGADESLDGEGLPPDHDGAVGPHAEGSHWDPALAESMRRVLYRFDLGSRGLAGELAELERQRRRERAQATAERIRQDAEALADLEFEQAREQLRAEVAELAAASAASLVRELLQPEDDRRLISEYAQRVEASQ